MLKKFLLILLLFIFPALTYAQTPTPGTPTPSPIPTSAPTATLTPTGTPTPTAISTPAAAPNKPSGVIVTNLTKDSVDISWNQNCDNTHYFQIWYKEKDKSEWINREVQTDISCTNKTTLPLKPNTFYSIHINACNNTACSDPTEDIPITTDADASVAGKCSFEYRVELKLPIPLSIIDNKCKSGYEPNATIIPPSCTCRLPADVVKAGGAIPTTLCTPGAANCSSAAGIECAGGKGVVTAIGCIHTEPIEFVKDFLKLAMGIAGGIGFLFMLYGVFLMITSAGNPDTLKNGSGIFTNAIIGLLFIIFSLLLLKIIGVDILGLGKQFGI